jgi:hypothetical protein
MSEPKRYRLDPESYLAEHPQGDFVDYQDYARLKAEVERLTRGGDFLLKTFLWTDEYSNDRYNDAKEKWLTAKTGKQPWQR